MRLYLISIGINTKTLDYNACQRKKKMNALAKVLMLWLKNFDVLRYMIQTSQVYSKTQCIAQMAVSYLQIHCEMVSAETFKTHSRRLCIHFAVSR